MKIIKPKLFVTTLLAYSCSGCMAAAGFMGGVKSNPIGKGIDNVVNELRQPHTEKEKQLYYCKADNITKDTPCKRGVKLKDCNLSLWDTSELYYSCVDEGDFYNFFIMITAKSGDEIRNIQTESFQINK